MEELIKLIFRKTRGIDEDCDNDFNCSDCYCPSKMLARFIYEAGYRKVPKGSFICSGSEANLDIEVCNNCGIQQADELFERDKEIERLKAENERLKAENERFVSNMKNVLEIEKGDAVYAVICDNVKRIFYDDGYYKEVRHYSVIHTVPNSVAIYYGKFDMKEAADERCEKLNKEWEECFGEQK